MSYNQKQKLQDNIEALRVIKNREGYSPLTEEIETLRKWSGCGGLKGVLNDWAGTKEEWEQSGASKQDLSLYEKYQQFFSLIKEIFPFSKHKEVINSLKNSTLTAFYTPSVIPRTFYEVLSIYMNVTSLYEPSAGSGVFLQEALNIFPEIEQVCAYEKDLLTAIVLERITESEYGHTIYNKPFEESSDKENGKYDLITSNIPFGEMKVYDPHFKDNNLTGKIHNYFFAKGIEKIREGGILAFLVSDAFLNTVSNHTIRKYLFDRCDFISFTVMPDNLMQDTGGTMAPSHFLVVQKNTAKSCLSPEEELLCQSEFQDIDGKKVAMNQYVYSKTMEGIRIGECKLGKNQYGKPAIEVHWNKPIDEIKKFFKSILQRDFSNRYKQQFRNPRQELLNKQAKWINEQDFEEIALDENLLKYNKEKWTPTTAVTQKEIDEINNSVPYVNETGYHSKPKDETSPWEEKPVNIEIPEDYEKGETDQWDDIDIEKIKYSLQNNGEGTEWPELEKQIENAFKSKSERQDEYGPDVHIGEMTVVTIDKSKIEAIAELSNLLPEYVPFKDGIIIEKE